MNGRYGKFSGDIKKDYSIAFAPRNMSPEECLANGYKQIIDEEPAFQPGYYSVKDHLEEDETTIRIIYKQIEIPYIEPVFTYSKYKLISQLMQREIWPQCKQMIEDSGLYDLFNAAQELKSDDPFFKQGIELAKTQLSASDDTIQEVLEASVAD